MLAAVLVVVALSPAQAGASSASFKTGLYTGTTSQHKPFAFYVRKTSECGHSHGLCLYDKTQAYIEMPCPNGTATNAYADPGPLIVPKSGIVRETITLFAKLETYIKLNRNGTASGHFLAVDEEGCTSGTVTFTAKRR